MRKFINRIVATRNFYSHCSSDDEEIIEERVNRVKRILADNFVRPDEVQKVLSVLRERGSYTVIDKITVYLNIKEDRYEADFSNLGIRNVPIHPDYPSKFDRLLCGGIWCILQLDYEFDVDDKKMNPIRIRKLTPIQMPHIDMFALKAGREDFTKEEWLSVLLRSTGMEPEKLSERARWLLLAASASMVFVGNINQSVDVLLKTSHLFEPFPEAMAYDTAFLDRMHCYVPGWEIPKYRPDFFTDDYGFITDYLSEFMREMRKESFGDAVDKYFRLGSNLNQRDTIAVRKMVSGFVKLLYPNGVCTKEDIEEILIISLEMRRRVKEQLKKIGGMEFYDVNFSYIDNESFEEKFVSVPEQGGGKLIPDGMCKPGQIYSVSKGKSGMIGVYRLETQMLNGSGKFERTGLGTDRESKEATNTAFNYLKANGRSISASISTTSKDYIVSYSDLNGIGMTPTLALPTLIAIASAALMRPALANLAVLGEISISGTIIKTEDLANVLQVCLDSGAKKVLLPITSAADLGSVPPELVGAFSLIFYSSPQEAVFKALGVE